jgi:hypothetical protein
MTHKHRRLVRSVAIVATLFGASTQAHAQDAFVSLAVTAQPAAAARMEQQARDLLVTGRGWERAADLYLRAAALRGPGDLESAGNLRLAGYVEFYRGRPKAAVASLTQAGEAFLALGDVERAAQAFIDGAWVAAQAKMPIDARALGERGRLLTQSPLLAAENRTALVRRLGEVPAIE